MDSCHRLSPPLHAETAPSTPSSPQPQTRENNNPPHRSAMGSGRGPSARQVWRKNLSRELELITTSLHLSYRFVAIDTEFPGFLRSTPRRASEEERYRDLKFNVDSTPLIQLGVTLLDDAGETPWRGCHWQINFSDFRPGVDACSPDSIDFLCRSGHDLGQYQRRGVSARLCSHLLRDKIFNRRHNVKFVTFHGLYDVAYVIKLITGAPLPETSVEFLLLARRLLGDFCDIKYMARFYPGLQRGELSLMKMSSIVLGDEMRGGMWHQAGYDSLLTGAVYHQMKMMYDIDDDDEEVFSSVLYGLEEGCAASKRVEEIEVTLPPLLSHPPAPPLPPLLSHPPAPPPPPPPHPYGVYFRPPTGFPVFRAPPFPALLRTHDGRMQFFCHGFPVPAFRPCCTVQPHRPVVAFARS